MSQQSAVKQVHFVSTAWFTLSAGYILVWALRQAGKSWWVIVSLSGYSALIVFLLISLYLFAIFRTVARSQKIEVEHPLTSTTYYAVFYAMTPFLSGLASCLGMIGENRIPRFLLGVALGTLGATFLVWIIVDPVAGLFEMLLPESRRHRLERLAELKALREKRDEEHKRLLAEVNAQEGMNRKRWQQVLKPYAEELAQLLARGQVASEKAEDEVVEIGARAWQIGGLSCMRQLHEMAVEICSRKYRNPTIIDYISIWWDGVGSWRNPSFG